MASTGVYKWSINVAVAFAVGSSYRHHFKTTSILKLGIETGNSWQDESASFFGNPGIPSNC